MRLIPHSVKIQGCLPYLLTGNNYKSPREAQMVRNSQLKINMPEIVRMASNSKQTAIAVKTSSRAPLKESLDKKSSVNRIKRNSQSNNEENSVNLYFNQIKHLEKLSLEDELDLANRIKSGDQAAVKKLVEANLKFVVAVSKNYRNQGMSFGDLINEGNVGLIKAARRFDGNAGCRFISYAVWWIRQGILVALAEQSRFLNISPGRIGAIRQIGKATQKLTQKLGREPDHYELANNLGFNDQLVTECLVLTIPAKSLSGHLNGEGSILEDGYEDHGVDPSDGQAGAHLLQKNIAKVLDQMEPRKAQVLRMSFGIGCGTIYTLKEIAEKLHLSRERVRQIRTSSLEGLRHPSKRRLLGI
jgi:RNA polymerase primary sigma factor